MRSVVYCLKLLSKYSVHEFLYWMELSVAFFMSKWLFSWNCEITKKELEWHFLSSSLVPEGFKVVSLESLFTCITLTWDRNLVESLCYTPRGI